MGQDGSPLDGHVERRRGRWQIVVELGNQPFRQCPTCRDRRRSDGRRAGSPRWWLGDDYVPDRCPECGTRLIDDVGRRQQRVGGFARKADAQEELKRIIAAHRAGKEALAPDLPLATWFDRWLGIVAQSVRAGELTPRTAAGYDSHVRNHLRPRLGNIRLRALTPGQVADLLRRLQADGLSAATARSVRATLSRALSDAMQHELVHRNVAQIARPPKVEKREPSVFTVQEFARIAKILAEHRLGALFLFAAYTGLRASELRGLRWSDIDLEAGTLHVSRTLHRVTPASARVIEEPGLVESGPKTEESGRPLPLSTHAVALLGQHRQRQEAERRPSVVPWPDEDPVFTTTIGTALEPSNVNRVWKGILEDAGVDYHARDGRGRGLHELRRTFATRLRERGVPLEDVQRLGRWSSPQVLLDSYAASDDARLRHAAEQAAEALDADVDADEPSS